MKYELRIIHQIINGFFDWELINNKASIVFGQKNNLSIKGDIKDAAELLFYYIKDSYKDRCENGTYDYVYLNFYRIKHKEFDIEYEGPLWLSPPESLTKLREQLGRYKKLMVFS